MMKGKLEKADIYFGMLLLVTALVYLSRIRLGLVDIDESFYLTIPYRLVQGDSLLVHEWHVSQLVGFILFPIMKIYMMVFKSTEGIYLAFRYIYLVFLLGTAVLSYILLKKKDKEIAVFSSIIFSLFSPFCIKALSYNTVGLMAVWLMVVVCIVDAKHNNIKHITAGVLLAIVVLCNPYMVIFYLVYTISCIWKRKKESTFSIHAWLFVTIGAAIVLVMFMTFLLSRVSLAQIIDNVRYIFYDPAHEAKTILDFFAPIIEFVLWFRLYFIAFFGGLIISVLCPKYKKVIFGGMVLLSILFIALLVIFKTAGVGKNAIMLPLTLLGGAAFILTKEKSWDIFCKGWVTGIIYAVCMNLSSNQGIYAICNACTISSCASLFLIKDFFEENLYQNKKVYWLSVLVAIQIVAEICILRNYVMWEDDISLLTNKIEVGPLKGVYTSEEKKADYEINYSNIMSMGDFRGKRILFFNFFPSGYLIAEDAENASFSGWIPEYRDLDDERIQAYYILHPEKVPDIIYIDTQAVYDWADDEWDAWCEKHGYTKVVFPQGGSALFLE